MQFHDHMAFKANGHVLITDCTDPNNPFTIVDKSNAIHPQNMARVIARALSRESNYWIHRIAFGNGGTIADAAYQITFRTPNDGQLPDTAGWTSRLYNETYSEIVDDTNPNISTGPGSMPGDPESIEHISGPGVRSSEAGILSQVVIESVLNQNEPIGQLSSDSTSGSSAAASDFTFDEIGLYTPGAPPSSTPGYQDIDVNGKQSTDLTGLGLNTQYTLNISIDNSSPIDVIFTTSQVGSGPTGEHTYTDLINELNAVLTGASATITGYTPTSQTYGRFRIESNSSGPTSQIMITQTASANDLVSNLQGFQLIEVPVNGQNAGVQNNPLQPDLERERLLSHITFLPVTKTANRVLKVTYTITVNVGRSINPIL